MVLGPGCGSSSGAAVRLLLLRLLLLLLLRWHRGVLGFGENLGGSPPHRRVVEILLGGGRERLAG